MIKKCKVLSYNKFLNILVFDYDGKKIQASAKLDTECKTVFIKHEYGKYEVVSKSEYDKYIRSSNKKKNIKEVDAEKQAETDNSEL